MLAPSRTLQAIGLMILSMLAFACMSTIVRLLGSDMPSPLMVFLRNVVSLAIVLAWSGLLQKGVPAFPTTRLKSHFWRASIGVLSMELWFYSLTIMPLTLATALSFTAPIFSTIFAIFFLGEKAGIRRWSAMIIGFIGVMVILRPDTHGVDSKALFVLLSSSMMAVAGVLVKSLTRTETPETIVFYMALFMVLWSFFPAIPFWQEVTLYQWWLVFLIALFSTVAHLMLSRAFIRADLVVLMPFDFTRLIFVAALAYPMFGETMDSHTLAGALIIVASTVYIAHRESRKRKENIVML